MSKNINNMSLKELLNKIQIIFLPNDIIFFCNDIKTIDEFSKLNVNGQDSQKKMKDFLIANSDVIDKKALLLIVIRNFKNNINLLKKKLEEVMSNSLDLDKIATYKMQIHSQEELLEQLIKIGRGMNKSVSSYFYDESQGRYRVHVFDSREIVDGRKINKKKSTERFNKVNESFKRLSTFGIDLNSIPTDENIKEFTNEGIGLELVIQSILLTDFYYTFPEEEFECSEDRKIEKGRFGDNIRSMVLDNIILFKGTKTAEEIEKLKREDPKSYSKLIDNLSFDEDIVEKTVETLSEYAEYLDMDKLLLVSAYRFNKALEKGRIPNGAYRYIKAIIEEIKNNIENKKVVLDLEETENSDSEDTISVSYSFDNICDCLKKFTLDGYIRDDTIEKYKELGEKGILNLLDMDPQEIDIIFTHEEQQKLGSFNEDNLIYVSTKYDWNKEDIIKTIRNIGSCSKNAMRTFIGENKFNVSDIIGLYLEGIIAFDDLREINSIKLIEGVNPEELNKLYEESQFEQINQAKREKAKERFLKYANLYKSALQQDSNNKQKNKENIMESIIEKYEEEDSIDILTSYYRSNLIDIWDIAEWYGENTIDELFDNGVISVEDLASLVVKGKIEFEFMQDKIMDFVLNTNIPYSVRLDYALKGYIDYEGIKVLAKNTSILPRDFDKFVENGIITLEQAEDLKRIEETIISQKNILGGVENLRKIKADPQVNTSNNKGLKIGGKSKNIIINPYLREDFLMLLGLRRINKANVEKDDPFYHYEFYAQVDEKGKMLMDGIVIAERFYVNNDTMKNYATNNATYMYKYKDFAVLSDFKNKNDLLDEQENLVYRVFHSVVNEKKNGNWAHGIIEKMARMQFGNLDEYSRDNQKRIIKEVFKRNYGEEAMQRIWKAADIIDGKGTYDVETLIKNGILIEVPTRYREYYKSK